MDGNEVFLRESETWEFVRSISDPTERLLTELSLAYAISFLVSDPDYKKRVSSAPLDLLTFARCVAAFFRNKDVLRKVLDGEITHIDDLDPFSAIDPS